jgi:hypothetical protein
MRNENENNRTAEVQNIGEQKAEKPNRRNTDVLILSGKL